MSKYYNTYKYISMSTTHPHYTSTDKCVKSVSMIRLLYNYLSTNPLSQVKYMQLCQCVKVWVHMSSLMVSYGLLSNQVALIFPFWGEKMFA